MKRGVATTLVVALIAVASAARAEDSMRCGSRLASTGDGKHKVRVLCGEPSDISVVGTAPRRRHWYDPDYYYYYYDPYWLDVPVEIWTYNLGPNKLLRKLRFVGEELVEISTEGYGY